jgi:hypothetical protein
MTRRRVLLCGMLTGLVLFGAGAWLLRPRTALNLENAAKIQIGITLAAVEAVVGVPG